METTCQHLAALLPTSSRREAKRAITAARLSGLPDDEISEALAYHTGWPATKVSALIASAETAADAEDRLIQESRLAVRRSRAQIRRDEREQTLRYGVALTGRSYPVRADLRALGCVWSPDRRCWLAPDEALARSAQAMIDGRGA
jgi:hypothetical protein